MKKWDDLDDSILGTSMVWKGTERIEVLVYSGEKIIDHLMSRDGMTESEAIEFIDFNIENAYYGKDTPLTVWQYYDE